MTKNYNSAKCLKICAMELMPLHRMGCTYGKNKGDLITRKIGSQYNIILNENVK